MTTITPDVSLLDIDNGVTNALMVPEIAHPQIAVTNTPKRHKILSIPKAQEELNSDNVFFRLWCADRHRQPIGCLNTRAHSATPIVLVDQIATDFSICKLE